MSRQTLEVDASGNFISPQIAPSLADDQAKNVSLYSITVIFQSTARLANLLLSKSDRVSLFRLDARYEYQLWVSLLGQYIRALHDFREEMRTGNDNLLTAYSVEDILILAPTLLAAQQPRESNTWQYVLAHEMAGFAYDVLLKPLRDGQRFNKKRLARRMTDEAGRAVMPAAEFAKLGSFIEWVVRVRTALVASVDRGLAPSIVSPSEPDVTPPYIFALATVTLRLPGLPVSTASNKDIHLHFGNAIIDELARMNELALSADQSAPEPGQFPVVAPAPKQSKRDAAALLQQPGAEPVDVVIVPPGQRQRLDPANDTELARSRPLMQYIPAPPPQPSQGGDAIAQTPAFPPDLDDPELVAQLYERDMSRPAKDYFRSVAISGITLIIAPGNTEAQLKSILRSSLSHWTNMRNVLQSPERRALGVTSDPDYLAKAVAYTQVYEAALRYLDERGYRDPELKEFSLAYVTGTEGSDSLAATPAAAATLTPIRPPSIAMKPAALSPSLAPWSPVDPNAFPMEPGAFQMNPSAFPMEFTVNDVLWLDDLPAAEETKPGPDEAARIQQALAQVRNLGLTGASDSAAALRKLQRRLVRYNKIRDDLQSLQRPLTPSESGQWDTVTTRIMVTTGAINYLRSSAGRNDPLLQRFTAEHLAK